MLVEEQKNVTYKKKHLVKVHSAIIQMANNIDLVPLKTWYYMLHRAYWYLKEHDEFCISVKELASFLEGKETTRFSYTYLDSILAKLQSETHKFNILGKDSKHNWIRCSLLGDCKIEDGMIFFTYGKYLRQHLQDPKLFAKVNILIQQSFSSKYAFILYNLFVDYLIESQKETKKEITIEELRLLFGLEEDEYTNFRNLNRDVIKKAISEVNLKSNITVDYIVKSENGRKAKSIMLTFKAKDSMDINNEQIYKQMDFFETLEEINKSYDSVSKSKRFTEEKQKPKIHAYSEKISRFCVDYTVATSFIEEIKNFSLERGISEDEFEKYVEYIIDLMLEIKKDKLIISGTFRNSLKDGRYISNYINRDMKTLSQEESKWKEAKKEFEKSYNDVIKKRYESYRKTIIYDFFSEVENHQLFISLIEDLQTKANINILKSISKNNDILDMSLLEDNLVKTSLSSYIGSSLYGMEIQSQEEFKTNLEKDNTLRHKIVDEILHTMIHKYQAYNNPTQFKKIVAGNKVKWKVEFS